MAVGPRLGIRRFVSLILALGAVCGLGMLPARASADETVYACGPNANNEFYESDARGMEEQETCGRVNGAMIIQTRSTAAGFADSSWATDTPTGLLIDQASVGLLSIDSNTVGSGYDDSFFWGPNGGDEIAVNYPQSGLGPLNAGNQPGFPTSVFGFRMVCGASSCSDSGASIGVGDVALSVEETQAPSISGGGLWAESGWVHGSWPITVTGDSPSGICSLSASIAGDPVTASGSMGPNQTVWHQCNGSLAATLNTALAANGSDTLSISDTDAAGLSAGASRTIKVDNEAPTVSLSGPATALSTAGTQYVTAHVTTGPSGAYGADCSVDGGPQTFYAGASSQVPVTGIGAHTVTCTGLNNAVSAGGARASSAPGSFTVDIQQPTVEAITFSKITDALKCRARVKRVRVLGKPRTIRLHGHKVQVRRYRTVKRRVRRCKARTAKRRVWVELKRHGKVVRRHGKVVRVRRTRRVVLLPHHVHKTVRHIKHGHRTTVSGILLASDGTPLAGQTITVMAAPNDADPQFAPMSSAVTNANGYWIAKVTRGPSRLLEAVYGGTPTTAAATSATVKLMVPARVRILSHTARVAWGQTAVFRGRVYGGFVPRAGINLKLRYGYGKAWVTYGVKTHVGARGRFTTRFTFGPGDPSRHFRFHFRFSTLPGGDYPWSHAQSNTVVVRVGGHPRVHRHRRHPAAGHRHRRRRRRS